MGQFKKTSKKIALAAVALIIILTTFTPVFDHYLESDKEGFLYSPIENTELIISFLDVGQGDATLILSEEDTILIDTGLLKNYDKLLLALSKFDIDKIDTLILTHPDTDHSGSAEEVVSKYYVDRVILNHRFYESEFYEGLYEVADDIGAEISVLDAKKLEIGNAEIELVSFDFDKDNDNSLVALVSLYDYEVLLTADISFDVEEDAIDYFELEDVEILKAAHHGSNSSTGEKIIEATTPEYSVISVGDNSYGHPHGDVLSRLSDSEILRTDKNGNITFYLSEDEIAINKEK